MSEFLACCVVLAASFANLGRTERAHTWHTENAIRTTSLSVGFVRRADIGHSYFGAVAANDYFEPNSAIAASRAKDRKAN